MTVRLWTRAVSIPRSNRGLYRRWPLKGASSRRAKEADRASFHRFARHAAQEKKPKNNSRNCQTLGASPPKAGELLQALDRHPPVLLNFSTELLSLAPGQHGTLELEASVSELGNAGLSASPNGIVKVTMGKRLGGKVEVDLEAISNGTATLSGPGGLTCKSTVGTFESHLGTGAVDLLARTCSGPDIRKIVAIQQILHSEETSVIDQVNGAYRSPRTPYACGDVVAAAGKTLFGEVSTAYSSCHRPIRTKPRPTALTWADIKYDEKVTRRAIDVIKLKVSKGIAVRVGMAYHPKPGMVAANGALQPSLDGGHFVLIVAFLADTFLYLDPLPAGSMTKFRGGPPFNKNRVCDYMGVLGVTA